MITSKDSFLAGFIAGSELVYSPNRDQSYMSRSFRARPDTSGNTRFGLNNFASSMGKADPEVAQYFFKSLGIYDKVLVCGVQEKGAAAGFCFNQDGRFCEVAIKARYNWQDDREFGIRKLRDCTVIQWIYPWFYSPLVEEYIVQGWDIYYSKFYADRAVPYGNCVTAFDWDRQWEKNEDGTFTVNNMTFCHRGNKESNMQWVNGRGGYSGIRGDSFSTASGLVNISFRGIAEDSIQFLF